MEHDRDPSGLPQSPPLVDENIRDIVAGQDTTTQTAGGVFSTVEILEGTDENGFQRDGNYLPNTDIATPLDISH